VSLSIRSSTLWWFGHVECGDDADWNVLLWRLRELGRGDGRRRHDGIVSESFGLSPEVA